MTQRRGRLIGIDHGIKRIGVATTDLSWLVARELCIIKRKSKHEDFEKLNHIASEQGAVAFVLGIPHHDADDASVGEYTQADTVRLWAERFAETTPLPIIFWDEQLTSIDATAIAKTNKRKIGEPIDDLAARVMLQSYLNALRDNLTPPPFPPFESATGDPTS